MKTELICLLDRSGSMARLAEPTVQGYNRFIESQREGPGYCRVSLHLFNTDVETIHESIRIDRMPRLTEYIYAPAGGTALLDALGNTLRPHRTRIKGEGWADQTIVYIDTDGCENASRQFGPEEIKRLNQDLEREDWKFIWAGANIDTVATARAMGSLRGATMDWMASEEGVSLKYASVSNTVSDYRAGLTGAKQ